jgi:hypothetical protein
VATIDTAIWLRLSGYAGLSALVAARIYPPPVPQNAVYPLVTYQLIDEVEQHAFGVASGIVDTRYQVDCWAFTLSGARALATQVRLALDNYAGTSDTIIILNSFFDSGKVMDFDPEEGVHRYSQDFLIEYRR